MQNEPMQSRNISRPVSIQLNPMLPHWQMKIKPTVLVIQYSESDGETAFEVPPASYLQTMIVSGSGGVPVWAEGTEEETGWILVNFEQIAAWDPDMIFVIDYGGNPVETVDTLKANSTLAGTQRRKE